MASDAFARTIALNSGWGNADVGGAWTTFQATTATATDFGVDGNAGQMNLSVAASNRTALLGATTIADFDITVAVTIGPTPVTAALNYYILPRTTIASAGRTGYRFILTQAAATNAGTANIRSVLNGTETPLTSVSVGTLTPSSTYWLRAYGVGTDLRFKVWADGTAEPGWSTTVADSAFSTGVVGVMGFVTTAGTTLPTILWDNFTAVDQAAAGASAKGAALLPVTGLKLPGHPTVAPPVGPTAGSDQNPNATDVVTPLPATQFAHPLSLVMATRLFPAPQPYVQPIPDTTQLLTATANASTSVTATVVKTAVLAPTVNGRSTVTDTVVKTAVLAPTVSAKSTVTATTVKTAVLAPSVYGSSTVTGFAGVIVGKQDNQQFPFVVFMH